MNVMLFLGSGISLPTWENERSGSGEEIPDIANITRSLLSGLWKRNGNTYQSRRDDERPCPDADRCQIFLQRLAWRVSPYFDERRGNVNYEDLFYLTDQLSSTVLNPAIQPFLEQARVACGDLCWRTPPDHDRIEFNKLCTMVCNFIQCVVWTLLNRTATPKGINLILDLAKRASARSDVHRLAICTLNHDRLVESLLKGISYEDGFGRLKYGGRLFDPKRLRTRTKRIRFLKLHGSITWFRWQRREGGHHSDHYVIGQSYKPQKEKSVLWIENEIPTILAGSYNKHAEYNRSIFKEFMYAFHSELSEHKLIVMSGYGWGDFGINERLCEWLGRDRSHRIVLLHEQAPWPVLDSSHVIGHQWRRLIRLRKLVVMRKWLQDTTWAEISERIEQVNKLRPCKPPSISDLWSGRL